MEDFLLVAIVVVLVIRWLVLSNRLGELKLRINHIIEDRQRNQEADALTLRVRALDLSTRAKWRS